MNSIHKTIVLVGLMGAGKSTVGRRLSEEIDVPFMDSDNEIVEAANCSIAEIFEVYGEQKFRDLEQRVIVRLLGEGPMILATGGGAFMNAQVREAIASHGFSIWLDAEIDVLLDRVSRRNNRPLLINGDKREILEKLISERSPYYALADLKVDNGAGNQAKVVSDIIELLKAKNILE